MKQHADCTSHSHRDPIDGLHVWAEHAPDCEEEDGELPCGVDAYDAEAEEDRLVEEYRAALRADRLIAESDRLDGEWTAACTGCLNGCPNCEAD